jgi:hypothetical protein
MEGVLTIQIYRQVTVGEAEAKLNLAAEPQLKYGK